MHQTYQIRGMHCGACVKKITAALEPLAARVSVTLHPPRVILEGEVLPDFDSLNVATMAAGSYHLMPLDDGGADVNVSQPATASWVKTYYPLLLIVGLIGLASFAGAGDAHDYMRHFMAGFFIVFGFFKLLDPRGFADSYAMYDLLAARWPVYGRIYPFLELGLGFMFLFNVAPTLAVIASITLMGFGSLGVIKALRDKRKIRCACLGTVLNLPMSTITLVEDLGMVAMGVVMLVGL